jgi:hypothetical protein
MDGGFGTGCNVEPDGNFFNIDFVYDGNTPPVSMPSLSQQVSTVPGKQYRLSYIFSTSVEGNSFTPTVNDVAVGGCSSCPILTNAAFSADFTATADPTTLVFSGDFLVSSSVVAIAEPILAECM